MVKVVTLFLIFIMILGILGKLRLPNILKSKRAAKIKSAKKCENCGQYSFDGINCSCKSKG